MVDDSIVGDLINFRGLVYAPLNENGVVFLFGKIMEDLNMYIEEIKPGFPDCIARRFTGKGWKRIRIEFEFMSKNFKSHGHDPNECDMIVCWEHDWKNCPDNLEVIELKDIIKGLENRPIERPDSAKPQKGDIIFEEIPENIKELNEELLNFIRTLSEDLVIKRVKLGYTVYSPQRVFIYIYFRKNSLRLMIFTRGESMEGVETAERGTEKIGGQKWGYLPLESREDIEKHKSNLKKSYDFIMDAVANNEPTGYYAMRELE